MKSLKFILFLLFLIFALNTSGYSQKEQKKPKCKYYLEKTDEFTGEAIKANRVILYFGNMILGFRRTGNNYLIDFYIKLSGEKNAALKTGEELQLKLQNGEILTFKSAKDVAPTTKVTATTTNVYVYSIYTTEYSCTLDDLNKIAGSTVTNLKINVAGEAYPFTLGKKEGPKVSNAAFCVTQ